MIIIVVVCYGNRISTTTAVANFPFLTGLGSEENCLASCMRKSELTNPLISLSAAFSVEL